MNPSLPTLRSHAKRIWRAGIRAADPDRLVADALKVTPGSIQAGPIRIATSDVERVVVVGAGKAGAGMAQAVERLFGGGRAGRLRPEGWVNVPDAARRRLRAIVLHGARSRSDNRPTRAGLVGTRRILGLLDSLGANDVVICLLSGGASSLLPAPVPGVSLGAKRRVTALLQEAGAPIDDLNAVRKHLSLVKGGGIAARAGGRPVISLILSDVLEDRLDVVASGPTAVDPTTFEDAIDVMRAHRVWQGAPAPVRRYLLQGAAGRQAETLKILPPRTHNLVIGNNRTALAAAEHAAQRLGYRVLNLGSCIEGSAAEAGVLLAGITREVAGGRGPIRPPACILAGGETTVRLGRRHGLGGRNQELALAALCNLADSGPAEVVFLSAGSDGEDGPTDAAGALVDLAIHQTGMDRGLDPRPFLARHDAYRYFDPLGALLKTGLTGTNVMDLQVILVGAR
jgi:glycerate 2-kinase